MRRFLSYLLFLSAGLANVGCSGTPATNPEPVSQPGEKDIVKTKVKGGVMP